LVIPKQFKPFWNNNKRTNSVLKRAFRYFKEFLNTFRNSKFIIDTQLVFWVNQPLSTQFNLILLLMPTGVLIQKPYSSAICCFVLTTSLWISITIKFSFFRLPLNQRLIVFLNILLGFWSIYLCNWLFYFYKKNWINNIGGNICLFGTP